MDYIFRRLALDHLPYEDRAELGILSAAERAAEVAGHDPAGLAEEVDPEVLAQSAAVEQPHTERSAAPAPAQPHAQPAAAPFPAGPHSTAELIESQQGRTADAPLCLTCGTKMRRRQLLRLRRLRIHERLQLTFAPRSLHRGLLVLPHKSSPGPQVLPHAHAVFSPRRLAATTLRTRSRRSHHWWEQTEAADRSASVLIVTSDLPDPTKLVAGRPGVAVVHVSKLGQPSGR